MSSEPAPIRGGTKVRRSSSTPASTNEEIESSPPMVETETATASDNPQQSAPVGKPPQAPPTPRSQVTSEVGDDEKQVEEERPPQSASAAEDADSTSSGRDSTAAKSSSDKEEMDQIKSLLRQAVSDIKLYKTKIRDLEEEKSRLKDSNSINAQRLAAAGGAENQAPRTHNNTTTSALKQKLQDLSIENHLAVERLSQQQKRINELEGTVEVLNRELEKARRNVGRKSTAASGGAADERASAVSMRSGARVSSPSNRSTSTRGRTGGASSEANVSASCGGAKMPPPSHHFDAQASVQLAHGSNSASTKSSVPNRKSGGAPSHVATDQCVSAEGGAGSTSYDEMMMNRFRRSLAPAPSKEELGELVHSMVRQLATEIAREGNKLPLVKVSPCVYKYPTSHSFAKPFPGNAPSEKASAATAFKKIHLTVDSSRLVVKSTGGGHTDFLEYLERNRIVQRNGAMN